MTKILRCLIGTVLLMENPRVIIIAMDQPLDNDAHIKRKMISAEKRAARQSSRFPDLDLLSIQKGVHKNILKHLLFLNGHYMDLLDLMNFLKNSRKVPELTRDNIKQYYSLADTVTHNGIYLYQYLLREGYDPVVVQNYSLANLDQLLQEKPLAVCISSNFIFMEDIKRIAAEVKEYDPHLSVIAGGMLIKKVMDEGENLSPPALKYLSTFYGKVDAFVVEAQGEQTLVKWIKALRNGGELANIPNLALFDTHGKIFFTPRERESLHMDDTALDWSKVPREYLRKTLPVNTSRGCAYRCRFCTYHWLFPEVHFKSLNVLRKELLQLQELTFVKHIRFTDDNFTANRTRLKSVLNMMIEEQFDFTWSSFARANALTPDLLKLMKKSGCEFVDMGIESGSQIILDNMHKRLKREQSLEAIRMLNDYGIYGRGSFIIGYPGETQETFSETIDLINSSRLPYYHPYLFYYSRNTLVHKERDRFGLEGLGLAWKHNTMDALEASHLMSQMIPQIDGGFTDGQTYIEEIYKLLRGDGYSPQQILELFRLKRELQLTLPGSHSAQPFSQETEQIFNQLEALIK